MFLDLYGNRWDLVQFAGGATAQMVFSFDSVITAVGMAEHLSIMVAAVVIVRP